MVDAKNFVEKTLGKNIGEKEDQKPNTEKQEQKPTYTPPQQMPEFIPPTYNYLQQPTVQVVEKIVYKKQRIHGFFRTLTILALLAIGFLMLGESTGIIQLSINSFKLHQVFPMFIIFSTIIIRSYKGILGKMFGLILFLIVFVGIFAVGVYTGLNPASKQKITEENIYYTIINQNTTGKIINKEIHLQTLIGNIQIQDNMTGEDIQISRTSDRNLLVNSGNNENSEYIKFNEDNNWNILQSHISQMIMKIPQKREIDILYIKNLIGRHTIDLSDIQRKSLKFHGGIDDITINVDNVLSGNTIEIQGTAAKVTLDIPKDIGVMMYYRHLAGMLQTPEFDILSGHYFQSKNIATAKAMLNIYINLGVGSTKINRVASKKN